MATASLATVASPHATVNLSSSTVASPHTTINLSSDTTMLAVAATAVSDTAGVMTRGAMTVMKGAQMMEMTAAATTMRRTVKREESWEHERQSRTRK